MRDRTMSDQPSFDRELNDLLVEHGQNPGESGTHWAGVLVRFAAELRRTATKNLGLREELRVNLESYDRLVRHGVRD